MTLVVGVACKDGFVIAADSEETVGDIKRNSDKLIGIEAPFQLVIGAFGYGCLLLRRPNQETFRRQSDAARKGSGNHREGHT
jgi:hypothetical protein